jgi:hypothetical protein
MALVVCSSCSKQTPDWRPVCQNCGVALTVRGRKQQESSALADRIAGASKDPACAAWQRTVIMDVVHGGGIAGYLLILTTVAICAGAFLLTHRLITRVMSSNGEPRSGGALFYLAVVVPAAILFFRLAAPLFYRLHVRLSKRAP